MQQTAVASFGVSDSGGCREQNTSLAGSWDGSFYNHLTINAELCFGIVGKGYLWLEDVSFSIIFELLQ